MHELSLLEGVRDILEREAESQQFRQVKKVTLSIGALSCVELDALRFAFDVVMKDSIAADAQLVLETEPALGRCRHCAQEMTMQSLQQLCRFCGKYGVDIVQGNTMKIKDLLVI